MPFSFPAITPPTPPTRGPTTRRISQWRESPAFLKSSRVQCAVCGRNEFCQRRVYSKGNYPGGRIKESCFTADPSLPIMRHFNFRRQTCHLRIVLLPGDPLNPNWRLFHLFRLECGAATVLRLRFKFPCQRRRRDWFNVSPTSGSGRASDN